jgi:hypothetical protein
MWAFIVLRTSSRSVVNQGEAGLARSRVEEAFHLTDRVMTVRGAGLMMGMGV